MNISDYKIVFMGTPAFASHILDGLYKAGFHIVAVVSQPDKEFGRKRILKPSEVKEKALELGIPVLTPNKIKDEYEEVLAYEPDLIITAAYGQFIPSVILNYPKFKCINAHGSLLPKYRGGAPIQRAIINGEEETGITIQYMAKKMDQGEILYQKAIPIEIEDTNTTMFEKLSDLALEMLLILAPRKSLLKATFLPLLVVNPPKSRMLSPPFNIKTRKAPSSIWNESTSEVRPLSVVTFQ